VSEHERRGAVAAARRAPRTRIDADARRGQIVAAARTATLKLGLHDVRVSDVAAELGVSTGLIHYHFDTKDELIAEMLRRTANEEVGAVRRKLDTLEDPVARLVDAVEQYLPSSRRDPSWLLWIDVWGEALRDAKIRHVSEELDQAWVDLFTEIVADGVARGVFVSADATASAWRICAMLDGLGLQVVLHARTMTRAQMRAHVRHAAGIELGVDLVLPRSGRR
jgi:AcrR family transcriptional regulator